MIFHHLTDTVDITFCFVIFYFQIFQLIAALFEKSQEALFLFLVIEILQFRDYTCQHLTNFPHILGAHIVQRIFGKIGDFLLTAGTILHDQLGVGNINLSGEIIHHFLFFRGQNYFRHFRFRFLHRRHFRRGGFGCRKRLKGQRRCFLQHFV